MSGRVDRKAALITALLLLVGLVILYSASAPFSLKHYGSDTYMLFKQFLAAIAGITLLLFFSWFDYHRLAAVNHVLFLGALGLTLLTILPLGIGEGRWLWVGPFALQPTELLKFTLII